MYISKVRDKKFLYIRHIQLSIFHVYAGNTGAYFSRIFSIYSSVYFPYILEVQNLVSPVYFSYTGLYISRMFSKYGIKSIWICRKYGTLISRISSIYIFVFSPYILEIRDLVFPLNSSYVYLFIFCICKNCLYSLL
jgi:hypothetical protein